MLGDALLGQFARMFVVLLDVLMPTISKTITWDYNPEDYGPIVPEWSGPSTKEKRSSLQAEFA
ncbi:hypothetical protein P3T76_007361 [Phytophthora citrophthora]|uniref:Uncharacterized protein n=1 Tax=Phytophthora citrophthora TaxID=4793 RepID=A0AAD9LLU1_9STRA|nr:hypothetical protein P3T76_007361 [Phytophthora citrophthora]